MKPGQRNADLYQEDDDQSAEIFCYKMCLYFLGILSLLLSLMWTVAELNNKILHFEEIVPDVSFAFDIAMIFFCLCLLAGVHRDRLDYMTPYFLTALILAGYCATVILTTISQWHFLANPIKILSCSLIGLILAIVNFTAVFKYMERLKAEQGIHSMWRRLRGQETQYSKDGLEFGGED